MANQRIPTSPALRTLIMASAGTPRNYRISFWGQTLIGSLYSFGYFDLRIVGFIVGFILPVIWVVSTYRLLKAKARLFPALPFPSWMRKDPGNVIIIIFDIFFLGMIWFFILAGYYEAIWIKVMFTIAFPLLTLGMLRNLIVFSPFRKQEDQPQDKNQDTES
ncbi:MAG: hypothetical protein R6U64_10090 [Bacteroidales bacterium]